MRKRCIGKGAQRLALVKCASLVVAEVLRELVNSATDLTGGGMGLNLPVTHDATIGSQAAFFFYAMLGLAAITFAAMLAATHSRLGFGLLLSVSGLVIGWRRLRWPA